MSKSVPAASELVGVVADFLEGKVLPTLSAGLWFECKVAINVLGMVSRELELGATQVAAERQRLVELMGKNGSLEELNRRLVDGIRSGVVESNSNVIDHLSLTIEDALRINNPKWLKE